MISNLRARISSVLKDAAPKVEARRGTAMAGNPGRALACRPALKPYLVTETCHGVVRRWVEFPKAGGVS